MMTKRQAVEETLVLWTHVRDVTQDKLLSLDALFPNRHYGCALCAIATDCNDCPIWGVGYRRQGIGCLSNGEAYSIYNTRGREKEGAEMLVRLCEEWLKNDEQV